MAEIVYGVATSLDGFIAPPDGGSDWLSGLLRAGEDYGFAEFMGSVGAVLMGSRTYEQSLGHGGGGSSGKPCYVFSSRQLPAGRDVTVTTAGGSHATLPSRGIIGRNAVSQRANAGDGMTRRMKSASARHGDRKS